jgi:hypothetical protein
MHFSNLYQEILFQVLNGPVFDKSLIPLICDCQLAKGYTHAGKSISFLIGVATEITLFDGILVLCALLIMTTLSLSTLSS